MCSINIQFSLINLRPINPPNRACRTMSSVLKTTSTMPKMASWKICRISKFVNNALKWHISRCVYTRGRKPRNHLHPHQKNWMNSNREYSIIILQQNLCHYTIKNTRGSVGSLTRALIYLVNSGKTWNHSKLSMTYSYQIYKC